MKNYKIIRLQVENIKRLKAADVSPDGNTITIEGKNRQGKSSLMDAIAYALGGKKLMPAKPVTEGKDRAEITIDLGEFVVTRTWKGQDKSTLKVEFKNALQPSSPQAFLDDMIGNLAFDPMEFINFPKEKRVAVIKAISGLDFTRQDEEYKALYEKRTLLNRDIRSAETRLAQFSGLPEKMKPTESYDRIRAEYVKATKVADAVKEIARIEEELANHKALLQELDPGRTIRKADIGAIKKRMDAAEAGASLEYKIKQRDQVAGERKKLVDALSSLLGEMDEINAEKARLLAAVKMPIDGLEIGEDDLIYQGIPFEQASSGQQIEVSMAMAMAENPKLKIIRIMNGSLLDTERYQQICQMAKDRDYQVWIEKVADSPSSAPGTIFIEDGEVRS